MKKNKLTVSDCLLIDISVIKNKSGNISVIENNKCIPFKIKRVYYLYDVSERENRGDHAHIECHQVLIAAFGSFQVILDDGKTKKKVILNKPYLGLHIPPGIWATETNFSKGSVCLVLASHKFEEKDYIRNYNDFIKLNQ